VPMFGGHPYASSTQMSCLVIGSGLAPPHKAKTPQLSIMAFEIEVQTTWSRMDHEAT
jgi:hypothetical protein